jgi:hypothetical protein
MGAMSRSIWPGISDRLALAAALYAAMRAACAALASPAAPAACVIDAMRLS